MKKTIVILSAFLLLFSASANAFDFTKVLGGKSGSSGADGLGSLLNGLASELLSTSDFELQDIVGSWKYSAPAVSLEGTNALQSLGGAAATSVIENKLAPYYQKANLTNLEMTIGEDSTFTMNAGLYKAHGTLSYSQEEGLVFNFQAFQSINLGKIKAQASKLGNNELSLTFDVSKLQGIVSKVAEIAKNQTFNQLSSMLSSYDGVYAGFKLTRVNEPAQTDTSTTPNETN